MVNGDHACGELSRVAARNACSAGPRHHRSIDKHPGPGLEQLLTFEVDLLFEDPCRPDEEGRALLQGRRSRSYLEGARTHRTSRLHRRMLFRSTDELTLRTGLVKLEDADQRFLNLIEDEIR
ncbi:MAG: hypothetical protein AAFV53_16735 [Myxococcota bacterium]